MSKTSTFISEKSQELLQAIIHKAWDDESFKAVLIANPIRSIEKETGYKVSIPKEKQLVVEDQTDDAIVYLNIPPKPNKNDAELSEAQLKNRSKGSGVWDTIFQFENPKNSTKNK